MNNFHFGQIIKTEGTTQFQMPSECILIWREASKTEAIFCESVKDIPSLWMSDKKSPWKIFGAFSDVKKIFPDFNVPAGTKVVDLAPGAQLQMNTSEGKVRFLGVRKKRVVIVDDSSTIRKLLKHIISSFENWEVVAEVESAEGIPEALKKFHPDLVTLDLHLGKVNGVEAMRKYLAPLKFPTLLITSQPKEDGGLVMDALASGALDYLQKPHSGKWEEMKDELLLKMEAALKSKWQTSSNTRKAFDLNLLSGNYDASKHLVTIGSSTGGTQALQEILTRLPANIPAMLITQHIPAGFSKALAKRLNDLCAFEVKEAEDGDEVRPGRVLIAPGDHHMKLSKNGTRVEVFAGEPVNRFRPSVEVMFKSVSANAKIQVTAIMLTGMGKDGAEAMLELRKAGAFTIAQDEASCVVFGMPKEAIRIGAAESVKSLSEIPEFLFKNLTKQNVIKKIS
jgi:two-component system chemotaxis response regulator CheB